MPENTDNRLAWGAAAITVAVYFVYILAIAIDAAALGQSVVADLPITWGALGGLVVIVFSFAIAVWYAGRVNRADES